MSRVVRVAGRAVAALLWLVLPVSVAAAPSPSPSLDRLLVQPPDGYATQPSSPYHGRFTAEEFAATWGGNSSSGLSQLHSDGFVDGYGMMWLQQSTGRYLAEFVIAFQGGNGAQSFLGSDNVENRSDSHYQHADSMDGIGSVYYGVHGVSSGQVLDGFEFVKGNDLLGVAFWSPRDDVLDLARSQTKRQYDATPAYTIPPEQWPESNRSSGSAADSFNLGDAPVAGGLIVLALLAGGAYMLMRRAERPVTKTQSEPQLTSDGKFWWSGSAWIATSDMAPPWAQRSPDGVFWWDGQAWQPVPHRLTGAP